MELKPGSRRKRAVCSAEIVVVRSSTSATSIECGGYPMRETDLSSEGRPAINPKFAAGVLVGKRYVHQGYGVEVLVVKAGAGSLSIGGESLKVKEAKSLPTSD